MNIQFSAVSQPVARFSGAKTSFDEVTRELTDCAKKAFQPLWNLMSEETRRNLLPTSQGVVPVSQAYTLLNAEQTQQLKNSGQLSRFFDAFPGTIGAIVSRELQ